MTGGLLSFQQASCDAAVYALLDDTRSGRYLIADEVGLGKTRVARAIVERLADAHPQESFVVLYLATNAEIAEQNLRVLRGGQAAVRLPSRTTLLPTALAKVRQPGIHVMGFTPHTSLDEKGGGGRKDERALIVRMLRGAVFRWPRACWVEVFRGSAQQGSFSDEVETMSRCRPDRETARRFQRAIRHDAALVGRLRALKAAVDLTGALDKNQRREAQRVVSALRVQLSRCCLASLEPSLIILDEFHRFAHVLREAEDRSRLAHRLIAGRRVLLLSATPYRVRAEAHGPVAGAELLDLLTFLFGDAARAAEVGGRFDDLRTALTRLHDLEDGVRPAKALREELVRDLREVMSRQERPQDLSGTQAVVASLATSDVRAYVTMQHLLDDVAQRLDRRRTWETRELWMSAPYLASFMRGYRAKQLLADGLRDTRTRTALMRALRRSDDMLLKRDDRRSSRRQPPHARYRELEKQVLGAGQGKALWLPPAMAPYRPSAPFGALPRDATKTLVFSSWSVVPTATASLLGRAIGRRARNGRPARSSARLQPRQTSTGVTGLGALAIAWPSTFLADRINPYELGRKGGLATERTVLQAAERHLEAPLLELTDDRTRGRPDARWYWAASMLLDTDRGVDVRSLLARRGLVREAWRSISGPPVEEVRRVLRNREELGTQPRNLLRVLALTAVGGAATCALRALRRVVPNDDSGTIAGAARIGWAVRTLLDRHEPSQVVDDWRRTREEYWHAALRYCSAGALEGVLDEYLHLLRADVDGDDQLSMKLAELASEAIELEAVRVGVDRPSAERGKRAFRQSFLSSRFAAPFGVSVPSEAGVVRPEAIRQAFNSPFWPWVLVTTSVGQEGLDFHRYCRSMVHWNVPRTAVDLEQREGRIQRYRNHAVRLTVAGQHGAEARASPDPWARLFELADVDARGFEPNWVSTGPGIVPIERRAYVLPYSRDQRRLDRVLTSRVYYRLVLGHPNPDELVDVLSRNFDADTAKKLLDDLQLDLSPG